VSPAPTTQTPAVADFELAARVDHTPRVLPSFAVPQADRLRLALTRPTRTIAVITVGGEIDHSTAPRLSEVVTTRLESAVHTVVIDLSAVTFLGSAGLAVLARAHRRANVTGRAVRLVTGSHCVDRALHVTGLDKELRCYADLRSARATGEDDRS
jgi:anti-sigma B factor antagonist